MPHGKNVEKMKCFESFCYTTVRLHPKYANGGDGFGTGFFYKHSNGELYLITNKHVIENAVEVEFLMHRCTENGNPVPGMYGIQPMTTGRLRSGTFVKHSDESVDLCAMYASWVYNPALPVGKLYVNYFTYDQIPNPSQIEELDAVEKVTMVGYPDSIMDNCNYMPIIRQGITATHYKYDFDNSKEFLVDIPVLPGSSGSPVFLCDVSKNKVRGKETEKINRLYLLGVLSSGFYNGYGLDNTKSHIVPIFSSDLANVIKSERILELFEE